VTSACVEYGVALRHKAHPQESHLAQKQRSRTVKIASRIVLTSILALSAAVPTFAAEEDTLLERAGSASTTRPLGQHVAVKHVQTRRATEARAYDPASEPAGESIDFGIGSQR
jgi:hypothetical protein